MFLDIQHSWGIAITNFDKKFLKINIEYQQIYRLLRFFVRDKYKYGFLLFVRYSSWITRLHDYTAHTPILRRHHLASHGKRHLRQVTKQSMAGSLHPPANTKILHPEERGSRCSPPDTELFQLFFPAERLRNGVESTNLRFGVLPVPFHLIQPYEVRHPLKNGPFKHQTCRTGINIPSVGALPHIGEPHRTA